jgi:cell shape-determining protein MreC
MIKNLLKIIALIIVAILSFKLTGCSSKITTLETTQKEYNVLIPEDPRPINLKENNYIVNNEMLCINIEDYKKEVYNFQELKRYIEQLKNQNIALKKIINEIKKGDQNGENK